MNLTPNSLEESQILEHEQNLRLFIDVATRYDINSVFQGVRKDYPFSMDLQDFVKVARALYDGFETSLRKEMLKYPKENWQAYEINLKKRFLPMIKNYKNWYNEHKVETEIFEPYNPYAAMLFHIDSTEKTILSYFPEPVSSGVIDPVILDTNAPTSPIDPLSFIDPMIVHSFLEAERKALGSSGKFNTEIRCAAFCELLWDKKHILRTKTKRKTLNDFAKNRYGKNIENALASGKNIERKSHQTQTISGQNPLKNCF